MDEFIGRKWGIGAMGKAEARRDGAVYKEDGDRVF
jgi:hypothetical protein